MAALDKIRNRAGLLVIMIGVALLAFLLGDILQQGTTLFRDNQMNAISVDGEVVKYDEYSTRVDQAQELYRVQTGQANFSEMEMDQIRTQVFQSIVSEHVLDKATQKLGLTVTPKEVFDLVQGDFLSPVILNSPLFTDPQTGRFDKAGLLSFLKSIESSQLESAPEEMRGTLLQYRNIWLGMENLVRDIRLNDKYSALISKAVVVNDLELNDEIAATRTTADLAYVPVLSYAQPDSIATATPEAIEKFYNKNKLAFKTDESRLVDLVYATITPSSEDIEQARLDVVAAREELTGDHNPIDVVGEYSDMEPIEAYLPLSFFQNPSFPTYLSSVLPNMAAGEVTEIDFTDNTYSVAKLTGTKVAPDSLFVRAILLAPTQSTTADSLLTELRRDPSTFSALADQHSANASANGGEIGWVTELSAGEYRDALFGARIGEPFRHTGGNGEFLFLVEKATAPVKKYNIALVTKKATASSKTITALYNEMNSFLTNNKNAAALDTAALSAGYQTIKGLPVYGMQPAIAQGIDESRELVRWAMENKKGAISEIKECGDKFTIAVVKKVIPRGYLSIEDARQQIEPVVLNEAKIEKLYADLIAAKPNSLTAYAEQMASRVDTVNFVKFDSNRLDGIGFEPAINAAAAYATVNQLTPVKGNNGVYLVQVFRRGEDTDKVEPATRKQSLQVSRQQGVRNGLLSHLIMQADIIDTRARFY